MDMIFEIESQKPEKRPTLLQFLESEKSAKLKGKYACVKIWFPNVYPCLTLETEDFRASIYENSPIFDQIVSFAQKMIEDNTHFFLVVNPERDGSFGITSSGEKGIWTALGKSGWEFNFSVRKQNTRASSRQ